MTLKEQVLDAFRKAEKPLRPGDVAKSLNVDGKEVSAVIKELKNDDLIYSPKRCHYSAK